jgi:hypothetical protein
MAMMKQVRLLRIVVDKSNADDCFASLSDTTMKINERFCPMSCEDQMLLVRGRERDRDR